MMRKAAIRISAALLCLAAAAAHGQAGKDTAYTEVFYASGDLRIQAYLYRPDGEGRFAAVIYNHGSRDGREQQSLPFEHIGRMLTKAGYAVLVPERRGYGKSDGAPWWREVGNDPYRVVTRLQAETDDVLAGVAYLGSLSFIDARRIGIMGWSFGGVVTMMAVSRSAAFAVAVDQAGGALTWQGNGSMRAALIDAAEKATTPTLFMVAKNDRTTASITTLAGIYASRGLPHRMILYDDFTPREGGRAAPGHAVFSAQGTSVWEGDVVEFLGRYLGAAPASATIKR